MANWTGQTTYATKKQLVSSIGGLYEDLQDFQFSTISAVSTLTVLDWLSAPVLYVSDIKGASIDISGILIDASGIFFAPLVSTQTANITQITNMSVMQFTFKPTFTGNIQVSFDLGLGEAIGGLLAGLGAAVGGGLIGVGTGVGLAIQGAEQGIATMIAGRPQNFITQNTYETINFTSQLQVSTLGNAEIAYSSIFRTVSSSSANSVPGREIFTSTIFYPGQICIRSASDPINLISGDSNLNTSTLQSFGQWVPLLQEPSLLSSFSQLVLSSITDNSLFLLDRQTIGSNFAPLIAGVQSHSYSNDWSFPSTNILPYSDRSYIMTQQNNYILSNSFISSPYERFQSTITTGSLYFITSTISTPVEFTYAGTTSGVFAVCEPDETGFRSTATMDFIASGQDLFIQWGLAVDNLNSTIKAGTSKRVSWDILSSYSNFEPIPTAVSTLSIDTTQQGIGIFTTANEIVFDTIGRNFSTSYVSFNTAGMSFGNVTALSNQPNYPYQFFSSVYVAGTLEATTIIALSSIVAVSTFSQTLFSTNILEASAASIVSSSTEQAYVGIGYISTLKASKNWFNDYIYTKSRVRMAGYDTPLSIVVGTDSNPYDPTIRHDFNTTTTEDAFYITAQPANKTTAYFTQSNVQIPSLVVGDLTTGTITYSNAEAPFLTTSTIEFGWTGSFDYGGVPAFSMRQYLSTPQGTVWNNYAAASNQVLNMMDFNNQVNMLAEQISTPLLYVNNYFGGSNREGWASTIFYNGQDIPARVVLYSNAGPGEVSFQASQNNIGVSLNVLEGEVGGAVIPITVPSTVRFVCNGSTWTTASTPPQPGLVSYSNSMKMSLDFERFTISTTDTLVLSADTIELNGNVVAPNLQLTSIQIDGFVSSTSFQADSVGGFNSQTVYDGSYITQPYPIPLDLTYTLNSTDFKNIRQTVTPSRGFNLYNGLNVGEWNNSIINIDTTPTAGRPTMIVGDVLQLGGGGTYSGQFWINNTIDGTPLVIPIYQAVQGVLSTIGLITGNTWALISTSNGINWVINSNVAQPVGGASYSNFYNVQLGPDQTIVQSGMPMVYYQPSLAYFNNKTLFYSPQIRVVTIDAETFNSREAGMENISLFENVNFSGGPETWESDSFNPIVNLTGNSYYSISGWECMINLSRLRTDNDIPISWELSPTPYPVGGGATDYIWGSARYLQVRTIGTPSANLIQRILMIPKNYFNFTWQGQGPIN